LYSEIPKTEIFDFISNIGGILGLFIGCSFVTLFELAELVIEIGFIFNGNNKQQINQMNDKLTLKEKIKRLETEMRQSQNETNSLEEQVKLLKAENIEIKASIKFLSKSKSMI
jgi:septal ring factor EnvC (AmiA/AmiB activator)